MSATHRIRPPSVSKVGHIPREMACAIGRPACWITNAGPCTSLARSHKVQLDVIAEHFGLMIDPAKLGQMRTDLEEFGAALTCG